MYKGYSNKILRVNLTDGKITTETINEDWARLFIGGRGYGEKMISEEVDANIDPLSPDNKVVFATGPLVGTMAPSASRIMVITKGTLNGTLACSNGGGYFGSELKMAGYDLVIFEGKASQPVYLWIDDDQVELRDASHIWSEMSSDSDRMLREETHVEAHTMVIGPAGEKLSKMSGVMFDGHRASGRTGVGAVVGSKNLKGIAVHGTKGVDVSDPEGFKKAVFDAYKLLSEHEVAAKGLPSTGTPILVNILNNAGSFPFRNAQDAYMPTANKISGETMIKQTLVQKKGCMGCPIDCGRVTEIREGKYKGHKGEGPEYETVWSLGSMCGVEDLNAITMAHYLCDDYGMDGISVGVTIACAMELYENGFMPKQDAPFPLNFGDAEAMVEMVKMIGERKGLGDLMSEGSYRLAEHYGHPELSMSVKKQEIPAYDPRGVKGIGLEYATSNRGACHVRGYTIAPEILGTPVQVDRLAYEGKAGLVKTFQDLTASVDASGACLFTTFGMGAPNYAQLLTTATGIEYDEESVMLAGERIWNLERLFNLKAGLTREDDTLPKRFLDEPVKTGPSKGEVTDLSKMLPEYYQLRGWDSEGRPTQTKLKELELD
ncbi:MAG: aldehyde ferredoxin oxidoreductase family protein [Deltaproteobacteria bacterium]|nr:aldehyde ferredoxin oxidoreductase family protein [Deltaproteobacteria bacterium]